MSLELKIKLVAITMLCGVFYISAQNGKVIAKESTHNLRLK